MSVDSGPLFVVVTSRRNPHKIGLIVFSIFIGTAFMFGAPPPHSMARFMPSWFVHTWAAALMLHGIVSLFTVFAPTRHFGFALQLEMGAMIFGAAVLTIVVFTIFGYAGWRGLLSGGLFVTMAVSNAARASIIYSELRRLRQ